VSLVPVTAVMILSARLLAQSAEPPQEKTAQHPQPLCAVSGSVVTAAEGTPLKSTRVALVPEGRNSKKHMYAASTDSDGRFLLKDVEQGRYTFLATRAGFVDQHYQAKGAETGATLSLKPGDKVSDVLFRMTLAAVITGRVTSEDGEAMVRIQVIALRASNPANT
jgi:5-hydroxyisourate hydrolase-like protein (transthyretin family)